MLHAFLYAWAWLAVFYTCFLAYASIQNVGWRKVPLFGKAALAPVALLFGAMDVATNATVGTAVFLQLPTRATITLSKRLAANIAGAPGWRQRWSSVFVKDYLSLFTLSY